MGETDFESSWELFDKSEFDEVEQFAAYVDTESTNPDPILAFIIIELLNTTLGCVSRNIDDEIKNRCTDANNVKFWQEHGYTCELIDEGVKVTHNGATRDDSYGVLHDSKHGAAAFIQPVGSKFWGLSRPAPRTIDWDTLRNFVTSWRRFNRDHTA